MDTVGSRYDIILEGFKEGMMDYWLVAGMIAGFVLLFILIILLSKGGRVTSRTFRIEGGCKAFFEILIREVQDCQNIEEVKKILDSWITANNLHPEDVESIQEETTK